MIQETAEILSNTEVSPNIFHMVLRSPLIAAKAKAGQFAEVKVDGQSAPLLRRPFGVHTADVKTGEVSVLFKVLGRGTDILGAKKAGEKLSIVGPLGNGFEIQKNKTHIIAAGGMGAAPMYFTAQKIAETKEPLHVFLGARTKDEIVFADKFKALGANVTITTDDGTLGEKCLINVPMLRLLGGVQNAVIYACGSHNMLRCVAEMGIAKNIETYLSLEEKMACGLGVCRGCPVEVKNKDTKYKMVCKDGPVFKAEDIVW